MQVFKNHPLKNYNTFGIDSYAKYFTVFSSIDEFKNLFQSGLYKNEPKFILGGGSNILFTKDFDGLVLKNEIGGIETIHEDEKYVYVKVGAGVNWHQFVLHCIHKNFAGVENLSLIPGNVGASPMQNIGAYGVEIKEVFYSLETYNYKENRIVNFTLNDCANATASWDFNQPFEGITGSGTQALTRLSPVTKVAGRNLCAEKLPDLAIPNTPPSVSFISPFDGDTYVVPANIILSVDATDSDGTVAKVEYYNGTIKIGESSTKPYVVRWKRNLAGEYSITAVAYDNLGATASATTTVTVLPYGPFP